MINLATKRRNAKVKIVDACEVDRRRVAMFLPCVFLRDDDIWSDDEVFLELSGFLKELRLPVIYGVIPLRLEPRMAVVLKNAKKSDPALVDIVQHGYQHANHAAAGVAKYEFGPGRSNDRQHKDMSAGLKIMHRSFGAMFTPAFIPPYHGYDRATLDAVEDLGFRIFSAGKKAALSGRSFLDLPARVALNKYAPDGTPLAFDSRDMIAQWRRAAAGRGVIGLVYHHRAIKGADDMTAIKTFFRFLALLRDQGHVRLALFSDLLRVEKSGRERCR